MNKRTKFFLFGIGFIFISFIVIFTNKSITAEDMAGMSGMPDEEMAKMEVHIMTKDDLLKELNNSDVVMVDIRETNLYKKSHIPNSINIPFEQFQKRFQELDKNKTIVLICHIGAMGDAAGQFLLENGYMHVANLAGGMAQWGGTVTNGD